MRWTARLGSRDGTGPAPDTEDGCTPGDLASLERPTASRSLPSSATQDVVRGTPPCPRIRDVTPALHHAATQSRASPRQASFHEQSGDPGVLGGRRHGGEGEEPQPAQGARFWGACEGEQPV